MKKRRYILFIIFIIVFSTFDNIFAVENDEILKSINDEMANSYGIGDYYPMKSIPSELEMNKKAFSGMPIKESPGYTLNGKISFKAAVYGSEHDDKDDEGDYRYAGYTYLGEDFPNPDYDNDRWSSNIPLVGWSWIPRPWECKSRNIAEEMPWKDWFKGKTVPSKNVTYGDFEYNKSLNGQEINDKFLPNFIAGLEATFKNVKMHDNVTDALADYTNYNYATHKYEKYSYKTFPWYLYYHVVQPPTKTSSGLARLYHCEKSDGSWWYMTVPLLCDDAVHSPDYSITVLRTGTEDNFGSVSDITKKYKAIVECRIDNYSQKTASKPVVKISVDGGVIVNQAVEFDEKKYLVDDDLFWGKYQNLPESPPYLRDDFNNSYTMKLEPKGGASWMWLNLAKRDNDYRAAEHNPMMSFTDGNWYKISCNTGDEPVERIAKKYIVFEWQPTKENADVKINCSITPEDGSFDLSDINNTDNIVVPWLTIVNNHVKYYLDYDEYSKDFEYNVNGVNPISASISRPGSTGYHYSDTWASNSTTSTGGASGALTLRYSQDSFIAEDKKVLNNPPVSGDSLSSKVKPALTWNTCRSSFNDDPVNKKYYSGADPLKLLKTFGVSTYDNLLWRNYSYSYFKSYEKDKDGNDVYSGYTSGNDKSEQVYSPVVNDTIDIETNIYNGKQLKEKTIPRVVTGDSNSSTKHFEWASKSIDFNVHRWMKNVGVKGNIKSLEEVPGKFTRTFKDKNEADITFSVDESLVQWFRSDITNAKAGINRGDPSYFPHAPFATDDWCKKISYPFKSGYYLDPGGRYKITVKTTIFKNGSGASAEHEKLVENIVKAFKYSSNLQYVNKNNQVYNINYPGNSGELIKVETSKSKPNYIKISEKLKYAKDESGATDKLFKEVMEGWSESKTNDSYSKFKYREFVSGSDIYKVTETTAIYITVNKDNQKYYTYVKMHGDRDQPRSYYINAGFGNFSLSGDYFNRIDVQGVNALDKIAITVVGNMYDDLIANGNQ